MFSVSRWRSFVVLTIAAAAGFTAAPARAVATKDIASGVAAAQLATVLTGAGVTITNAKITGANNAAGTFTGGSSDGLAVDEGVILSTGDIKTAAGPNTSEGTTGILGSGGDAALDALVTPFTTKDAVILEFDAVTVSSTFAIRYVFASEEYREFVGSQYNDVFAFFVDGTNIALLPGSATAVAVNTVNHQTSSSLYRDNPSGSNSFGTSFDGFTVELTAVATVTPNAVHHVRLAIADASDASLDSAVFLAKGGISGSGVATIITSVTDLLTSNLQADDIDVTVFGAPTGATAELSASGLPEDSTVTFTPNGLAGPNTPKFKMHVAIGPDTPAGTYPLIIRAGLGTAEAFGFVLVFVDCTPPMILGTPGHQPSNTTAGANGRATLAVSPVGSFGFTYQWYRGHSGSTAFPIAGATSATLNTPVVTGPTEFWVRVTNACGSRDSATAVVTPAP